MTTDAHPQRAHELDDDTIDLIAAFIFDVSGIILDRSKAAMISSRISKKVQTKGHGSIANYVTHLKSNKNKTEVDHFISAFTTNMTRFSRERHHFDYLRREVASSLVSKVKRGKEARVWSAGCSTGEEAYDIAFHLLDVFEEHGVEPEGLRILATDIDPEVLQTAQAAEFSTARLRDVSERHKAHYFEKAEPGGSKQRVKREVTDRISFRRLNLHGAWPMTSRFDVIMCRNVVIYFDRRTSQRLWSRFHDQLDRDGILIVGHSENPIDSGSDKFVAISSGVFRKSVDATRASKMNNPIEAT